MAYSFRITRAFSIYGKIINVLIKKDLFFWLLRESTQKGNTAKIYDDLVAKDQYDAAIEYPKRVKGLSYALSLITNKYHDVLDIACGTGAFIDALKVIGIDISEGMLSVTKKRFEKYKNITFKQQDVLDASFPKESFDLITIAHATRFIPHEKEKDFADRVASWLRKDGMFIALVPESPFSKIAPVIHKLAGIPRGVNLQMHIPAYFSKVMSSHFILEREKVIDTQYKIFKGVALYFRKK